MENNEVNLSKKKLGLVLGAGGSRGVAHIGVLQALLENGVKPYCISGTSAGSVVGSLYCAGISPQTMFSEVMNLKKGDIIEPLIARHGSGLFSTKRMHATLKRFLGERTMKDLKVPFCCVATDLVEGTAKRFTRDSSVEVARAVCASSCIPAIFEPIRIEGVDYVDGSLLQRLPIEEAQQMNPDVIVAVDVFDRENSRREYNNFISVLMRAFDIMDQEKTETKTKENAPDVLIKPNLSGMLQYTFKGMDDAYYEGYAATIASMNEIKSLLQME